MTQITIDDLSTRAIERLKDDHRRIVYALLRINRPEWAVAGRVHDWRNYVDPDIQHIWFELPPDVRVYLYLQAENLASYEHWD